MHYSTIIIPRYWYVFVFEVLQDFYHHMGGVRTVGGLGARLIRRAGFRASSNGVLRWSTVVGEPKGRGGFDICR